MGRSTVPDLPGCLDGDLPTSVESTGTAIRGDSDRSDRNQSRGTRLGSDLSGLALDRVAGRYGEAYWLSATWAPAPPASSWTGGALRLHNRLDLLETRQPDHPTGGTAWYRDPSPGRAAVEVRSTTVRSRSGPDGRRRPSGKLNWSAPTGPLRGSVTY